MIKYKSWSVISEEFSDKALISHDIFAEIPKIRIKLLFYKSPLFI